MRISPVRRRKTPYVRSDVTGDPPSPVLDVVEDGLRLSIGVPTPRDPYLPTKFACPVQVGDRSRMAFGSGVVDTLQWARIQFWRLQNPDERA